MNCSVLAGRIVAVIACVTSAVYLAACSSEQSSNPRERLMVTAGWLAGRVDDSDLVIIHVGDRNDYLSEHIPGARLITLDQVSKPRSDDSDGLALELPEPRALEEMLEAAGTSDNSTLVVYWAGERVTPSTRVVFTLDWAGLGDRTRLLDGGLWAWKHAGYPVTSEVPLAEEATLTLKPRPDLVVDAMWVEQNANQPGIAVVDARAAEFFTGEREYRGKAGHIPGARSIPWTELVNESLMLKSAAELHQIFEAAGVAPADRVVVYCHIGQYATMVMFAARTIGHEVHLYDGAFQDWALRDLPLDVGHSGGGG